MAAGLYPDIRMNPMWGAAAMALSSFTVCMNALRLNLFKLYDPAHDRKIKHPVNADEISVKEERKMTKTLKVEGMMCEHCEARVKKALEAVAGVENAAVDHKAGTAVVTLSADVTDDELSNAVTAQDYKVLSIG